MASPSFRAIGIACAIASIAAFSLKTIFAKLIYRYGVDSITLIALRMAFSLPFFVGVAIWLHRTRDLAPLSRGDWFALISLGLLGYYVSSLLDFWGLEYVSAGIGRLQLYIYPTLTVILSAVFLKKPIGAREIVSLLITYTGVALVVSGAMGQDPVPGPNGESGGLVFGLVLIFCSALGYAVYLVFGSETIKRIGSLRFTAYAMTAASLAAILQFPLLRPWSALELPPVVWLLALTLAIVSTVLPLFISAEALKRIGANQFSVIGALGPVVTIFAGNLLLDETMTLVQWLGALLVIGGVLLVTIQPSKPA